MERSTVCVENGDIMKYIKKNIILKKIKQMAENLNSNKFEIIDDRYIEQYTVVVDFQSVLIEISKLIEGIK